jgi:hypothetical protein
MCAIDRVARLLGCCGNNEAVLPPTALFNEGWMLRLVLDWSAHHRSSIPALRFAAGSIWYSEALLPTRFRPRKRGDTAGEGFTHADGVIGHFQLRVGGRGDIELLDGARQFTVIEAKMASELSAGTKYAPEFNQAARNMACIANLISIAGVAPDALPELAFVLLAPAARIDDSEVFGPALDKENMRETVRQRVESYDVAETEWLERWFDPVLQRCSIQPVSWESVLKDIAVVDADSGKVLSEFYAKCLRYNPLRPFVAAV